MDQVINSAASIRYMFGAQVKVPLVIRMPQGAGHQLGPTHSHSFEALYQHVPGMWLLREPLSKVGPAIVLCYLPMIAMTVDGARRLAADWRGPAGQWTRTVPTALSSSYAISNRTRS